MFCGNCGNELKPGARFCPSCGSAVKPVQEQTDESTWESAPADQPEAEAGSTAAAPVMTKTKRQWTRKRKTMAVAGVVLILIALFATLGGSGGGYADGLVEADNAYGLSTTVTLEEFIELYNQRFAELNEIERGRDYEMMLELFGGLDLEDADIIPLEIIGMTTYQWSNALDAYGGLHQTVTVSLDNISGFVVGGSVSFLDEAYDSNSVSDTQRNNIFIKLHCILYAMAGGESSRYDQWNDLTLSSELGLVHWEKGLAYASAYTDTTDVVSLFINAMTEEAFEKWSTNTLVSQN